MKEIPLFLQRIMALTEKNGECVSLLGYRELCVC